MGRTLFLTGASGFVGRCLLRRIAPVGFSRIVCLLRHPEMLAEEFQDRPEVEWIGGDLLSPKSYAEALAGCDTVLHLAAVTGKARPAEYFRVNRDGTKVLLEQCRAEKVRNVLLVSSIAVKFADLRRYYYAQSKQQAEAAVAASGMRYTIVRPTAILGPGSPIAASLGKLACLPVIPVFGDGTAKLQPIHVENLVDCLLTLVQEEAFANETLELGGPEIIAIEELLRRLRRARGCGEGRVIHLPLRIVQGVLGLLEGLLFPVLPITAGQLAMFGNDGMATPTDYGQHLVGRLKSVDEMLKVENEAQHRELVSAGV